MYNLGAAFSYASILIFLWHAIVMLIWREHAGNTLVLHAWLTLISFLLMAPYKWDKKWMRLKQSVGILIVGLTSEIYSDYSIAY